MPYALCPMPYALDPRAPHVTEKGYINFSEHFKILGDRFDYTGLTHKPRNRVFYDNTSFVLEN